MNPIRENSTGREEINRMMAERGKETWDDSVGGWRWFLEGINT